MTKQGLTVAVLLALSPLVAHADDAVQKQMELEVRTTEQIAEIFNRDQHDCNKMARDLDVAIAGLWKKKGYAKLTPEQEAEIHDKYWDRMDVATQKMRPGMVACGKNPKVNAAMAKMSRPKKAR